MTQREASPRVLVRCAAAAIAVSSTLLLSACPTGLVSGQAPLAITRDGEDVIIVTCMSVDIAILTVKWSNSDGDEYFDEFRDLGPLAPGDAVSLAALGEDRYGQTPMPPFSAGDSLDVRIVPADLPSHWWAALTVPAEGIDAWLTPAGPSDVPCP